MDKFAIDRSDHGQNNRRLQDKETSGSLDPSYSKLFEYNFNIHIVELVSAMRNTKEAQFLRPMRFDPMGVNTMGLMATGHGTANTFGKKWKLY